MPNLAYFELPVDDLDRAKKFYQELLIWEFTKSENPDIPMEYWMIKTGPAEENTLNMGGMYKRRGPAAGILTYIKVSNLELVLRRVEESGGKVLNPRTTINMVGAMATILDPEGNMIALWEPENK